MENLNKLYSNIEQELSIIADKGLNNANFETAYKLVDMMYKLNTFTNGNDICLLSASDAYDMYAKAKYLYKHEHNDVNRQKIMQSLKDYMTELSQKLSDMIIDCDCEEERMELHKFLVKLSGIK